MIKSSKYRKSERETNNLDSQQNNYIEKNYIDLNNQINISENSLIKHGLEWMTIIYHGRLYPLRNLKIKFEIIRLNK